MQARYFEVDLAGGEQALESMMCLGGGVVFLASSSSGWTYYCELTVQYIPSSICSVQIYHISVQEVGSYQDARHCSYGQIGPRPPCCTEHQKVLRGLKCDHF